jgi:hypothetical protein
MEPLILDNVLPESYVAEIEHTLTKVEFDWHFRDRISYGNDPVTEKFVENDANIIESRAFVHRFFHDKEKLSQYCDFIRPILYFVEPHTMVTELLRMRGVFVPRDLGLKGRYNVPHIDTKTPHKTLIYYVNDSDGGTIIFNEKYDFSVGHVTSDKKTIKQIVQAKRGRMLIFDGTHYHTGMIPAYQDKILININFN